MTAPRTPHKRGGRVLGVAAVLDMVGLPAPVIAEYIRRGHFPGPRQIGEIVGWSVHEVRTWLDCRAQAAWALVGKARR